MTVCQKRMASTITKHHGRQTFLVSKALSTLVAMGTSQPKTLKKLENALNIRPCTKVTPYINPFDALDILHKLADDVPHIRIQNGLNFIYVEQSEADKMVWKHARITAAVSGRAIAKPTKESGGKYLQNITHQICSFLAQNQKGSKEELLEGLTKQAVCIGDCEPQDVVNHLQKHGYLKITDDDIITYSLPSHEQMELIKSTLIAQLKGCEDTDDTVDETKARYRYRYRPAFNYNPTYGYLSEDEEDILDTSEIPDLRVLLMLYEMAPEKRPLQLADLLKEVIGACRVMYVLPPSQIFADKANKKYVKCKNMKRGQTKVAIGVKGKRIEDMELTPAGILGIQLNSKSTSKTNPQEKEPAESNDEEIGMEKTNVKKYVNIRRRAVTRGQEFCKAMVQLTSFTSRSKGSTLVEASSAEKKKILSNLENWLESVKPENQMDLNNEAVELPTRRQIWQELIKRCIGETKDMAPSALVLELQKMDWLSVDRAYPHKITYNLPNTCKNAPWIKDSEKVLRKTRMGYLPYVKSIIPSSADDEMVDEDDGRGKRKQCKRRKYGARTKRRCTRR